MSEKKKIKKNNTCICTPLRSLFLIQKRIPCFASSKLCIATVYGIDPWRNEAQDNFTTLALCASEPWTKFMKKEFWKKRWGRERKKYRGKGPRGYITCDFFIVISLFFISFDDLIPSKRPYSTFDNNPARSHGRRDMTCPCRIS